MNSVTRTRDHLRVQLGHCAGALIPQHKKWTHNLQHHLVSLTSEERMLSGLIVTYVPPDFVPYNAHESGTEIAKP